jgi:hypothetical protein
MFGGLCRVAAAEGVDRCEAGDAWCDFDPIAVKPECPCGDDAFPFGRLLRSAALTPCLCCGLPSAVLLRAARRSVELSWAMSCESIICCCLVNSS